MTAGSRWQAWKRRHPELSWWLRHPVVEFLSTFGHWEWEHPFKTCPTGERHCPHTHWRPDTKAYQAAYGALRAATTCRLGLHSRKRVRKYGGRCPELCRYCRLVVGSWRDKA